MRLKISMILNNNAIMAYGEDDNKEYIVFDNGIGFNHKKNEEIIMPEQAKMFVLINDDYKSKMLETLQEVPIECLELTEKIVKLAESRLNEKLNYSLLFNLADHINFTIQRYRNGINISSLLNEEMKCFYEKEYKIGEDAVKIIDDYYHIHINKTEAAAIAFHIINSYDEVESALTKKIVFGVKDIVNLTENQLSISINKESLSYSRFVIHLKMFLKSIICNNVENYNTNDNFLYKFLSEKNSAINSCLVEIEKYIENMFNYKISKNDRTYLAVHLFRLMSDNK